MKHCILMTIYNNVEQVNAFIDTVPDNFNVYVHIDKKTVIEPSEVNKKATCIKQYSIFWGGVNHLLAFYDLLKLAFSDVFHYDYYHLITGQDIWACCYKDFDRVLGGDNKSYLDLFPLPCEGWQNGGLTILQYRTLASFGDVRYGFWRVANNLFKLLQRCLGLFRPLPRYPLYGGSVYCSLTDQAVNCVLKSPISDDLLGRLKNSTCGEEIFFQTVLANSDLKEKLVHRNLRYIDWSSHPAPKFLGVEDYSKVFDGEYLFCRKIRDKEVFDFFVNRFTSNA